MVTRQESNSQKNNVLLYCVAHAPTHCGAKLCKQIWRIEYKDLLRVQRVQRKEFVGSD